MSVFSPKAQPRCCVSPHTDVGPKCPLGKVERQAASSPRPLGPIYGVIVRKVFYPAARVPANKKSNTSVLWTSANAGELQAPMTLSSEREKRHAEVGRLPFRSS